jgi:integrase
MAAIQSADKAAARHAPIMRDLCDRFMSEHSKAHNKPKTIKANEYRINRYIVPALGHMKVQDVTRADVVELMRKHQRTPTVANHNLSCLRKMFNLAEVWLLRPDGSNPCRHVAMFPRGGKTRLITDSDLGRIFAYLGRAEAEGLEHPTIILAVRLQFAFAARVSEIINLEWSWIDLPNRRIVWPDSKTGGFSKPICEETFELLHTASQAAASNR